MCLGSGLEFIPLVGDALKAPKPPKVPGVVAPPPLPSKTALTLGSNKKAEGTSIFSLADFFIPLK